MIKAALIILFVVPFCIGVVALLIIWALTAFFNSWN